MNILFLSLTGTTLCQTKEGKKIIVPFRLRLIFTISFPFGLGKQISKLPPSYSLSSTKIKLADIFLIKPSAVCVFVPESVCQP